ncbi:MAG: type II toxin-antitoxin system VapC family toxin [Candidatus Dormibacteria bacterium]
MVVLDANVLVYAVNESLPHHARARRWLEAALNGDESVGFAWTALLAFIRIATLPALSPQPLDVAQAFDLTDEWLGAPAAVMVHPTARHGALLRGLLLEAGTAGNLVGDAHLAALAVEHGARVCSFDRDFGRFPGVSVVIPT